MIAIRITVLFLSFLIFLTIDNACADTESNSRVVISYDNSGRAHQFVDFSKARNVSVRTQRIKSRTNNSNLSIFRKKTYYQRQITKRTYQFFDKHATLFRLDNRVNEVLKVSKFNLVKRAPTDLTLQQIYRGVPVMGAGFRVNINSSGDIYNVSGHFLDGIKLKTRPKISKRRAALIALNDAISRNKIEAKQFNTNGLGDYKKYLSNFNNAKLYIYNESFLYPTRFSNYRDSANYKLVWHVTALTSSHDSDEYLIDAHSGELLRRADSSLESTPNIMHDCSGGCNCPITRNGSQSSPVGVNPIYGGFDVDNAYDYFNLSRAYYVSEFGRNGATNFGGIGDGLFTKLNESRAYLYYDACGIQNPCTYGGAWFSLGLTSLYFCAGSISLDVFGHEYFHAFNHAYQVNHLGITSTVFGNSYETGSLNEAMADLFGEDFASFHDITQLDWLFATSSNIQAKRSFSFPEAYSYFDSAIGGPRPYPDRYSSENMYCGSENSGGVHWNSTIISKAAFLASVGTTGWGLPGENFNQCTIDGGIGLFKVIQILYHTMMRSTARINSYNQFYDAVNIGCSLLVNDPRNVYNVTHDDCRKMRIAMESVQIDQPGRCNGFVPDLPASCSPQACTLPGSFRKI